MDVTFELSDQVIGIILKEEVDSSKIKEIKSLIEERLNVRKNIHLYLEDRLGNGMTLKAFFKDLVFEMKGPDPFSKIAVVTDSKWFQFLAELKEKLVTANVQAFESKDRIEAMNWVME